VSLSIYVDEKTKEWIRQKGGIVSISLLKAKGCCGGGPFELETKLDKPKQEYAFDLVKLDDLFFFIQKNISVKNNQITLKLSGFGPIKYVTASGLSRFC
jgi:hypothetical protein